ncbi:hypothetical protein [Oceanobacillus sp. CF4.6]|uniref:hypothetical protein n=1 Tax=Oceanobacillus sp. CF4.6 TaxID=3373080 RepID=UPI003EE773FC
MMMPNMKRFEQKEWDLYDTNLGQALESVEKGDLQCASECFKRIAWVLHYLSKDHSPVALEQEINMKQHIDFSLIRKDDDK